MCPLFWQALALAGLLCRPGSSADISGTWLVSTQLTTGQRSQPIFTLVQKGDTLSGSYQGVLGKSQVTGKIQGNEVTWEYETKIALTRIRAVYTGMIKSSTEMAGSMKYNDGKLASGTWTGQKKIETPVH